MPSEGSKLYSNVYIGFIFTGFIACIIGSFTEGSVSLGAFFSGYSMLIFGIMMLLLILFNNELKGISQGQGQGLKKSYFQLLTDILITSGPFLLIISCIIFNLYLIITYKKIIIDGNISKEYYTYNTLFIFLLLINLMYMYGSITSKQFKETGKLTSVTSSSMYLFGVIISISVYTIYIILTKFETDGFTLQ